MRIVFGCDPNAAELKKNLMKMCQELAQMDRALDSDSKGRWFESSRAYQNVLMKDATPKTPHFRAAFSHIMRHF